jgi:thiol-disulfide isomerase/thioredoxin
LPGCARGVAGSGAPPTDEQRPAAERREACPLPAEPERDPGVIAPEQRAPSFRLTTSDCRRLDSGDLIGKQAFVVVFFATWCDVCRYKLPLLRRALDQHAGQLPVLLVSLDEDDTWPEVPEYLARHGLSGAVVRGHDFMAFSAGYNPYSGVPLTVIVGRSGRVLDVQLGLRRSDFGRLMQAMDAALAEPPESAAAAL